MVSIKSNKWQEISLNYAQERDAYSIPALISDKLIVDLIKKSDKNILDFGAWIGTISKKISEKMSTMTIYIYEPNTYMLELLKKNIIMKEKYDNFFITHKFKEIEDIRVDVIICNNVLDHIKDIEKVISYFNKVLNNRWHLILSIPHPFKNAGERHKSKKWNIFKYDYLKVYNYMQEWEVFRNREDVDWNIVVKNVNSFNRKLETYFKVLLNNNFSVMWLYEPWPEKICWKKFPIIYNKTSRIPYFLILDCYKTNGNKN